MGGICNKYRGINNKISGIKLVFSLYATIKMMHGPINLSVTKQFEVFRKVTVLLLRMICSRMSIVSYGTTGEPICDEHAVR